MEINNTIYAAGFFDGEGCVTASFINEYLNLRIYIVNTNKEVIDWFQETFGGRVEPVKEKRKGCKDMNVIRFAGDKAENFIDIILPYTKVKTNQLMTAKLYFETRRNNQVNDPEFNKSIYSILKKLNKRGKKTEIE